MQIDGRDDLTLSSVCSCRSYVPFYEVMTRESKKRKRHGHAPIGKISYALIEDRNKSKINYLNNNIWKNDVIYINMLRLTRP
jgi:hypothetical protein